MRTELSSTGLGRGRERHHSGKRGVSKLAHGECKKRILSEMLRSAGPVRSSFGALGRARLPGADDGGRVLSETGREYL